MQIELSETFLIFYVTLGLVLLINAAILIYIKRIQDERYLQILSQGGRNAFVFVMIMLPIIGAMQFMNLFWIAPGFSIFALWVSAFFVLYGSSYYYYRS